MWTPSLSAVYPSSPDRVTQSQTPSQAVMKGTTQEIKPSGFMLLQAMLIAKLPTKRSEILEWQKSQYFSAPHGRARSAAPRMPRSSPSSLTGHESAVPSVCAGPGQSPQRLSASCQSECPSASSVSDEVWTTENKVGARGASWLNEPISQIIRLVDMLIFLP